MGSIASRFSFDYEMALMSGATTGFIVNKFGRNPDVDGPEDIWGGGGTYTGFPTGSAETLTISSSSAEDGAAGLTGALTLRILGMDTNFNLIAENVTLNGTSNVTTSQSFKRMYRAYVLTAGSNTTNVGDITIKHTTTVANIFAVIPAGFSQTEISGYTIPAGYTGYLHSWSIAMNDTTANTALCAFWIREPSAAVRIILPTRVSTAYRAPVELFGGISLPEKTDIMVRALSVANTNADIIARFDLIVLKN